MCFRVPTERRGRACTASPDAEIRSRDTRHTSCDSVTVCDGSTGRGTRTGHTSGTRNRHGARSCTHNHKSNVRSQRLCAVSCVCPEAGLESARPRAPRRHTGLSQGRARRAKLQMRNGSWVKSGHSALGKRKAKKLDSRRRRAPQPSTPQVFLAHGAVLDRYMYSFLSKGRRAPSEDHGISLGINCHRIDDVPSGRHYLVSTSYIHMSPPSPDKGSRA